MDFRDQPLQQKSISWKLIVLIGGGILIAGSILFFVIRLTRSPSIPSPSSKTVMSFQATQKPSDTLNADTCKDVTDQEKCLAAVAKQTALEQKKVDACLSLSGSLKDDCVWAIAKEIDDPETCKKIEAPDFLASCFDEIIWKNAVLNKNDAQCDKIQDVQVQASCHDQVQGPITEQNCASRKKDSAYCAMFTLAAKAKKAQDPSICDTLGTTLRHICREQVSIDDPDFDGIDSTVEREVYHTDPHKLDTDGDGYSDGDEVRTHHDPLKK